MSAKMSFEQYHGVPEKPVPGETVNRSALLTTLLSAVPIIGCPIMGIVIDKYQCNAVWTTLGSFVSIAGHILLMAPQWLSEATPFWLLVVANCLLGAGYCMLASSIWTLLSYTVTDADSNIAYGMIQSMQHIGFIIASKSDGAIIEASTIFSLDSYFWLEVFFSGVLVLSGIISILFLVLYHRFWEPILRVKLPASLENCIRPKTICVR